jgi:hypothetical protein
MFIELTDHLRCPVDHDEAYLVLLPDVVEKRDVRSGRLGCPVCNWEATFTDGVVNFGGGMVPALPTALSAEAINAFLGLSGPGGYIALVGAPAGLAPGLTAELRGVSLVLVNPPAGTIADPPASVIHSARMPVKSGSMRGVVMGRDFGDDPDWVKDAVGSVLPGLRIVIEGDMADLHGIEVLAESPGVLVGRRTMKSSSPDR